MEFIFRIKWIPNENKKIINAGFLLTNDEKCARLPKWVRLTGHKPNYGSEYTNLVRYFIVLFSGFIDWHIRYSDIEKLIKSHSFLINGTHNKI